MKFERIPIEAGTPLPGAFRFIKTTNTSAGDWSNSQKPGVLVEAAGHLARYLIVKKELWKGMQVTSSTA